MQVSWFGVIGNGLLRILNLVAYAAFLYSDVSINGIPTDPPQTYFSPKNYMYQVWMILRYYLLIGYHVYQFFPGAKALIVDTIGWKFTFLTIFAAAYSNLRFTEQWLFAFICAAAMFVLATYTLFVINARNSQPKGFNEVLWVYVTLAIYHAYSLEFVLENAFIQFGVRSVKSQGPGNLTRGLVVASQFALFLTQTLYTFLLYNPSIELPAGYIISLTLFGIYEAQRDDFIKVSALTFFSLSCLWLLARLLMFAWYSSEDESTTNEEPTEETPLLAGETV